MRRVIVERPGGYEALRVEPGPDPQARAGQVRVRVQAAGVNFADCIARMGYYAAAKGHYPLTPGFEFAGTVDAVGPGAARVREGDRVFGVTRFGAYADCVVVDARQIWPCPAGWSGQECAAFPAAYLTAYYALFEAAKVQAGETLLIHSAAGGVGSALLQLARIAGCRSVAVVGSGHKAELCRELGAQAVIDRSHRDLWAEASHCSPSGYDAIFDANGISTPRPGFQRLAPGGRLVIYGFAEIFPKGRGRPWLPLVAWNALRVPRFSPLDMAGSNRAVIGFNVIHLFHKHDLLSRAMERLLGWVAQGYIRKVPITLFSLELVADAHRALESGTTVGKLVLTA